MNLWTNRKTDDQTDRWMDRSKEKKNDFFSGFDRVLTCIFLLGLCHIHFGWIPDIRLIIYARYLDIVFVSNFKLMYELSLTYRYST